VLEAGGKIFAIRSAIRLVSPRTSV
jgi:hypothetical protein